MSEISYDAVDWSSLPTPQDDGAARHLMGAQLPSIALGATNGDDVDLSALGGLTIVYIYPKTGQPGVPMAQGWDMIPGARGCTPQSCAFRDHAGELRELGVEHIFGLSTQSTPHQRELKDRLHLPFEVLSDCTLAFARAMNLPMFVAGTEHLLKRLTLVIRDARVVHVQYPVFPPDQSPRMIGDWLRQSP